MTTRGIGRALSLGLALFLSATVFQGRAAATVGAYLPEASLVRLAEVIVRGTVVSHETAWDAQHQHVWTRTVVHVSHWFKGNGESTLVVRTLGGQVGTLVTGVAGMPTFTDGEEVMLFLHPHDDFHVLAGMAQGVYRITSSGTGPVAARDLTGITLIRPGGATEGAREQAVPLRDFEALVTSLVAGAR